MSKKMTAKELQADICCGKYKCPQEYGGPNRALQAEIHNGKYIIKCPLEYGVPNRYVVVSGNTKVSPDENDQINVSSFPEKCPVFTRLKHAKSFIDGADFFSEAKEELRKAISESKSPRELITAMRRSETKLLAIHKCHGFF